MRYSGIQPQYFPRLHYFARILNADIFMVRDEAQFVRKHKFPDGKNGKSYQANTIIKLATGPQFLSVPIKRSAERFQPIFKTEISYHDDWAQNHLSTIKTSYFRAKHFPEVFPMIEQLLKKNYKTLAELNLATILWGILVILEEDITEDSLKLHFVNNLLTNQDRIRLKKIRLSSESVHAEKFKTMNANEKIVALIKEVGADEDFCGGTSTAAYLDFSLFEKNGIKITVQEWHCKEYEQLFQKQQGFIANLSVLDLLLNASRRESLNILSE